MGFEVPRSIYTLDFEGTELHGLLVKMRGGKLGDAFDIVNDIGRLVTANPDDISVSDAKLALSQYENLADHLVSWNFTINGQDVPANLDGLKALEIRHVQMVAAAWQRAQVNVPAPLPRASSSSPATELSSIPMETLPASLAS